MEKLSHSIFLAKKIDEGKLQEKCFKIKWEEGTFYRDK